MSIDMLLFDYRKPEEKFFRNFNNECYHIKFFNYSLTPTSVQKLPKETLENITVISVFITSKLNKDVLKNFKNLRVIATRSTGFDHIDIEFCAKHNIAVFNVNNYGAKAVAQYTFGLILSLTRKIIPAHNYIKSSPKQSGNFIGRNLDSLTIGIIGTGAIGGSVCNIANNFKMKILANDPQPKKELINLYNIKYVSFDELLKNSDIITLHLPYTKENKHLIAKEQFQKMDKKPIIINTSRGELINITDLKNALNQNQISGVGLDVLTCESLTFHNLQEEITIDNTNTECINELNAVAKLTKHDNVIITPHIAYETEEAINFILTQTMNNISDYFKGASNDRIV